MSEIITKPISQIKHFNLEGFTEKSEDMRDRYMGKLNNVPIFIDEDDNSVIVILSHSWYPVMQVIKLINLSF